MKKHKIAIMLQDFCFGDNKNDILSPEIQNIFLLRDIKKMSDKKDFYEFDFLLKDGSIISEDLKTVKGFVNDYKFDFLLYVHQQPGFDTHRVCLNWVPQDYLTHYAFWQINNDPLQASSIITIIENYKYNELNVFLNESNTKLLTKNSSDCAYFSFNPFIKPLEPKNDIQPWKIFYSCATLPLERHGILIRALDQKDYCNFYGHPSNWIGIKNYKKQIPYGYEIYNEINKNGICLAIHSNVHCKYEFYTNRVAEACFSGSLMITDDFENLKEIYGDTIFTINTNDGIDENIKQIDEIVKWANSNPDQARKKILDFQKIFSEKFLNKDWIYKICNSIENSSYLYKKNLAETANKYSIDVIYHVKDVLKFNKVLSQIYKQYNKNFKLIICCSNEEKKTIDNLIQLNDEIKEKNIQIEFIFKDTSTTFRATGYYFDRISEKISGDYFSFINENSLWNEDHISRLIWQFDNNDNLSDYLCMYSGISLLNNNKFFNLDASDSTICYPINIKSLLDFYNPVNIVKNSEIFSSFTKDVEVRFPKGAQIFKKEVINLINNEIKNSYKTINDCEHIVLLVLLAINDKMQKIHFSPFISYHIDLGESKNTNEIKKYLYPNMIDGEYIQAFNSTEGQLTKIFFDNVKFRSLYSIFGIHSNIISFNQKSLKNKKSLEDKINNLINKNKIYIFIKIIYFFIKIFILLPWRKFKKTKNVNKKR
jgi:hypothetical protein